MKFQIRTLASWLAAGAVFGAASAQITVGSGLAFPVSPDSLLVTIPLIGVGIFFATLPIARYRHFTESDNGAKPARRPNPFFAFRALILSRAVMISGAGFLGWHLGLVAWLFSFSVLTDGTLFPSLLGVAGSAVMLLGGALGQRNCRTPRDRDGEASS